MGHKIIITSCAAFAWCLVDICRMYSVIINILLPYRPIPNCI